MIGVGNPYRRDDGAGLEVLARLHQRFGDDQRIRLVELDGEPVRIIQAWEGSDMVLIVDAVRSTGPAGVIHHFDSDGLNGAVADAKPLGGGHAAGVGESIDLARALGLLPPHLDVVGVEGADFDLGDGLSEPVTAACVHVAEELGRRIELLLRSLGSRRNG